MILFVVSCRSSIETQTAVGGVFSCVFSPSSSHSNEAHVNVLLEPYLSQWWLQSLGVPNTPGAVVVHQSLSVKTPISPVGGYEKSSRKNTAGTFPPKRNVSCAVLSLAT